MIMLTDADKKLIDATLEIEQDLKMIAMIDSSFARLRKEGVFNVREATEPNPRNKQND